MSGHAPLRTSFYPSSAGALEPFPIPEDCWLEGSRAEMQRGHIDPLLFALMTSALTPVHRDSGGDRFEYLRRVVALYNACSIENVLDLETGSRGGRREDLLMRAFHAYGLEGAKIHCLIHDSHFGTGGRVSSGEMVRIFGDYISPAAPHRQEGPHHTYSAFPKETFLPVLRDMRERKQVGDEQVVLVLASNFHSLEHRRSGGRYLNHPMAVASIVFENAGFLQLSEEEKRQAVMIAMIHDIGEKSNLDIGADLNGVLSDGLIQLLRNIHHQKETCFFGDYIGRQCAPSRILRAVKMADSFHNIIDSDGALPSFKQAYVYPIVLNYLRYVETCSDRVGGVDGFIAEREICSLSEFNMIKHLLNHNRKVAVSEVAATIPLLRNLIPAHSIFSPDAKPTDLTYDHLHREAHRSLQL